MTATLTAPPVDKVAPHVVTRVKDGDLAVSQMGLLGLGLVLIVGASAWGMISGSKTFYFSYLTAYMGVLGICLGALFFTMIQHITRAGWSVTVRRVAENTTMGLWVMLLLYVPILAGFDTLYEHWTHADIDPTSPTYDAVLAGKAGYLSKPFFFVRLVLYFAIWLGLATWFRSTSRKQDETGDPTLSLRMARVAAPGLLLFALSVTFAAFDWIMSLDPHWFSTMFGICYFAGGFMAFLAFAILFTLWLGRRGYLREAVGVEHYHDLGKLMFAFVVFWTYVNFSQYMLIWYANLPEETVFYAHRQEGGWSAVGTILIFGHFLVPFAFLMSRHVKRNMRTLSIGAIFLLVIHWVDMQYLVVPNAAHGHAPVAGDGHGAPPVAPIADHAHAADSFGGNVSLWLHHITPWDVMCYLGMLSLVAGVTLLYTRRGNLLPTRDPRLAESLHFHNI